MKSQVSLSRFTRLVWIIFRHLSFVAFNLSSEAWRIRVEVNIKSIRLYPRERTRYRRNTYRRLPSTRNFIRRLAEWVHLGSRCLGRRRYRWSTVGRLRAISAELVQVHSPTVHTSLGTMPSVPQAPEYTALLSYPEIRAGISDKVSQLPRIEPQLKGRYRATGPDNRFPFYDIFSKVHAPKIHFQKIGYNGSNGMMYR